MRNLTRRHTLVLGAGGALVPLLGRRARAQEAPSFAIEPGAEIRLMRWRRWVEGDEAKLAENTQRFMDQTGVKVDIQQVAWDDVRPKAAVAANVGQGPDIVLGTFDDPHLYPDQLLDLTEIGEYLDQKYGWYDVAKAYGKKDDRWIGLPLGAAGYGMVHRVSWMNEAGFDSFPQDTDGLLALSEALAANGRPTGYPFCYGVSDGNAMCHYLLWAFGGRLVDENNNVAVDSPETRAALEYAKQLYAANVPGTIGWNDASNNKAFLAGDISVTINSISVYYAARNADDPRLNEMAKDIGHAPLPVGPVGRPTELATLTQLYAFDYTPYPNAVKAYLTHLFEREQYVPWQAATLGYLSPPLKPFADSPLYEEEPEARAYQEVMARMLPNSHAGDLGYASQAVLAEFIVVDMFAQYLADQMTLDEAIAAAAARAARYYEV